MIYNHTLSRSCNISNGQLMIKRRLDLGVVILISATTQTRIEGSHTAQPRIVQKVQYSILKRHYVKITALEIDVTRHCAVTAIPLLLL